MNVQAIYILLPSFRAVLLRFFDVETKSDVMADSLAHRVRGLWPSYLVSHAFSQEIVDYLKKLPYEEVFQLIANFGQLEVVPPEDRAVAGMQPGDFDAGANGSGAAVDLPGSAL